jgi:hypothetical protein
VRDYRIRLRGGWEWHEPSPPPGSPPRRVALPLQWDPAQPGPVRLIRHFGSPPIDPQREALELRLENVPGIVALCLNGEAFSSFGDFLGLPLQSGRSRNELVIDIDPRLAAQGSRPDLAWGQVAIVVRPLV